MCFILFFSFFPFLQNKNFLKINFIDLETLIFFFFSNWTDPDYMQMGSLLYLDVGSNIFPSF